MGVPYLVVKWPLQQRIKLSLHQHEEHREVCLVSDTISIEVGPDAHLVAIPAGSRVQSAKCSDLQQHIAYRLLKFRVE